MPEFLKQLIALGMVSMISLSRGYDASPPVRADAGTEIVAVQSDQPAPIPAAVVTNGPQTPTTERHSAPAGVTVLQSNSDVPQPESPASPVMRIQRPAEGQALDSTVSPSAPAAVKPDLPPAVAPETTCGSIPPQRYGSLSIRGGATGQPAAGQADLNLGQRAWRQVNAPLSFQSIGGPTDENAPRFSTLFAPGRVPRMTGAFQVYNWDFRVGRRTTPVTSPAVTLLGLGTAQGEPILLPNSGYGIGEGYAAMVLYADTTRLTLKYTREDNVAVGYTLHLENLCVDPSLLALYRYLNAAGRRQLPAARVGQSLGIALGSQILTGIQDSGAWMDPRSRKDWWQ